MKYLPNCFTVSMIEIGFLFWYSKKSKSLGSSDDRADQIAGRNDDNTLGILRANLELKHMFIMCS